jgi:hypothetical protein
MRMTAEKAPSDLFPYIVNTRLTVEFHFVGRLLRDVTYDWTPGRNYEGMITARPDTRGVVTASDRWAQQ